MKFCIKRDRSPGFAIVEMVLAMVASLVIIGTLYYVFRQNLIASFLNRKSLETTNVAPAGTTSNIKTLTQQDLLIEASEDTSADEVIKQSINSANDAVNDLGGAYDVSDL